MASRAARKSTVFPVKRDVTVVISYIRELPGAVFFGDAMDTESIEYAARLRRIRREFENDADQELLRLDCQEIGFESNEIRRFVANPAAITNCGYGTPIGLR